MADANDFRVRVILYQAQEITHVLMIKVYADDAVLRHAYIPLLRLGFSAKRAISKPFHPSKNRS